MFKIIWDIMLLLIAAGNFVKYFFYDGDVVNIVFGCTIIILLTIRDRDRE